MASAQAKEELMTGWIDLGQATDLGQTVPRLSASVSSFSELGLSRQPSLSTFSEISHSTATQPETPKAAAPVKHGGAICVGTTAWSHKRWKDARWHYLPPVKQGSECWCEFYTGAKCVHCECGRTYEEAIIDDLVEACPGSTADDIDDVQEEVATGA